VKKTAKEIADGISSKKLDSHESLSILCTTCRQLKDSHKFCAYHCALQPGFDKNCAVCSQKS
ncbi:hypothetical protein ACFLQI_03580, partial [Candidatus Undinarchaeota archaeon]